MAETPLLRSARHLAQEVFQKVLRQGDTAVDATLGRGRDCLALCQLVGETGRVYGFDVQQSALNQTRALLSDAGLENRASLHLLGHEHMKEVVPPGVNLVAFNLGYLPGGDKQLTTKTDTTLKALNSALSLLMPLGVLVVCVYPGHPEGEKEQAAILEWAEKLSPRSFTALWHQFVNGGPGVPACLVVEKM